MTADQHPSFTATISIENGEVSKHCTGSMTAAEAETFANELVTLAIAIRNAAREQIC